MDSSSWWTKNFFLSIFGVAALLSLHFFWSELHLHPSFIAYDVGQGDALHFRFTHDFDVLIDGGPDGTVLQRLGESLPWYDRTIEVIVMTHTDADHLAGLIEVAKRYHVKTIVIAHGKHETPLMDAFREVADKRQIPFHELEKDEQLILPQGTFDFYQPNIPKDSSENNRSVVARFHNAALSLLLTGDSEQPTEQALVDQGYFLQSDILKAGHHGSKTSTSQLFLDHVSPKAVVISAGRKNRYGHPHQEILDRLATYKIFRTDEEGSIHFSLDVPFLP